MKEKPISAQEEMEKAKRELETDALIRRHNTGSDPLTPAEEPVSEDEETPTHTIQTPQPTPDEVIDEEGLGAKDR